jgi:hypothetical protein
MRKLTEYLSKPASPSYHFEETIIFVVVNLLKVILEKTVVKDNLTKNEDINL